jgi:hypothetical protein
VLDGVVAAVVDDDEDADDDVDEDVPVVDGVPSPWPLTVVPAPLGVAPPPAFIVEEPPVLCALSFDGTVMVVVDVVTVVGVVAFVRCEGTAILTCCV